MRRFRLFHLAFLLLAWPAATFLLRAQNRPTPQKAASAANAVPVALGHSLVALTGPWKFHIGDNPQWADPTFNDSGWETVTISAKKGSIDPMMGYTGFVPGWTAKGHPGYAGFAWYRIRIHITGADEPLALLGPSNFDDSYQIFVNSRLIGSFGDFNRPVPTVYVNRAARFALPAAILRSRPDGTAVIAVRFFMAPRTLDQPTPGGFHAPPVIGFADAVAAAYHVAWEEQYRSVTFLIADAVCEFVFAFLILALYVFDRTETILLWPFGASLFGALSWTLLLLEITTNLMTSLQESIALTIILEISMGLWAVTFLAYFGLGQKRWLRNAIAVLVLWGTFEGILTQILLLGGPVGRAVFKGIAADQYFLSAAWLALSIAIGWLGWRRPHREHWTLFLALFFFTSPYSSIFLGLLHIPARWFLFGAPISLDVTCEFLMMFCFAFVLLRHFRTSQRRQQAMEEDVQQAQQVQQVLIPEQLPHIPGLAIESEYRPAREVGGDFFQIIPDGRDGSVLIVAGDVTGKGLQAGMLVALLVGAIRSTAELNPDPSFVLNALNRRLCGRGQAHATCLAMRIESNGAVTLANAGHLPPYLNGKELPMEGALPLGMAEGVEFSQMNFQLQPGDRLTLLTDGVIEAQNEKKELFGFARTNALLLQEKPAAQIAAAAQAFGQQDDITVLTIEFAGAAPPAALREAVLA